jgi:hypothetical protein
MELNLYDILPEEISDAEASRLCVILMELALAVEKHYYCQIDRHSKTLHTTPENPF